MSKSQLQTIADDLRKTEENISSEEVKYNELQAKLSVLDEELHGLELAISEKVHYIENLKHRRNTLKNRVLELLDASE